MPKTHTALTRETEEILGQMGSQIKKARLRRKMSSEKVAKEAGISRATLVAIEKGSPSVAMGCYASVLHRLGSMDKDLLLITKADGEGGGGNLEPGDIKDMIMRHALMEIEAIGKTD